MPNDKNKDIVSNIKEKLTRAKSIVLTDYSGLSATRVNELRQTLRDNDAELVVAKNTLMKVALKEEKIGTELEKDYEGPVATIFSFSDPIQPIKALFDFIKKVELPRVKSAIIDGRYSVSEEVEKIKNIPSKEQLLAQFVGGLQGQLRGLVRVLNGNQQKLVYALKAIADKKQENM